ncbi:MAG TPA: Nif3-like dinuclear metal center hexameric protein [Gemmatimonadaceae bacterium]
MSAVRASDLSLRIDRLLGVSGHPDYPRALNGLQVDHRGPARRIAAAVDASLHSINMAADQGANFMIVHHGLFWGGAETVVGAAYERLRRLFEADIALYSVHLPLDSHSEFGNNALLAREFGLTASTPFGAFQGVFIGVAGETDMPTEALVSMADTFSRRSGGRARASAMPPGHRTRRWAICSGAGASSETLREAQAAHIDTLITGEGPHHTAVEAPERGVVVIYAGHYATETLGVSALAERIASEYDLPWSFLSAPTGL